MTKKMELIQKIKDALKEDALSTLAKFIIGWVIVFDLVAGTAIPLVYGHDCGWFAIPNLIIDTYVIIKFIKAIRNEDSH